MTLPLGHEPNHFSLCQVTYLSDILGYSHESDNLKGYTLVPRSLKDVVSKHKSLIPPKVKSLQINGAKKPRWNGTEVLPTEPSWVRI